MFGAILKAANSSFQKGMTFCISIHVKKVMKLLAFIFEQPSYELWVMLWCVLILVIIVEGHLVNIFAKLFSILTTGFRGDF